MLERIIGTAGAFVALALTVPAAADAEKVIEAQIMWRFDAMSYTIDQGELLTFRNADALSPGSHNVTAEDKGPDGRPLFASKTVPNGETVPVDGARQLTTGSYGFICTVHPFMAATLTVTDKGAPLPPGGSPPPPSPPPPQSPPGSDDTRAPQVAAAIERTTVRAALRSRRFRASITSDEAVTLRARLTARRAGRTITLGTATASYRTPGQRMGIAIKARRAGLRAVRGMRSVRLTLAVEARDAAGNLTTATARRTIRR